MIISRYFYDRIYSYTYDVYRSWVSYDWATYPEAGADPAFPVGGGGPIRLGKNLTDCLKDILLASQEWVKDGKRFQIGVIKPPLLFFFLFFFFFSLHMTHTKCILRCIFSRIYQLFHLLL